MALVVVRLREDYRLDSGTLTFEVPLKPVSDDQEGAAAYARLELPGVA